MKTRIFAASLLLALAGCVFAQESNPSSPNSNSAAQGTAQSPDRAAIDETLKSYVNAYGKRSVDDLVAVWPDLANQKKEYKKIKEHFADSTISNDKVSLGSCETQAMKEDAVVKCERTEEYVKTESNTTYGGDAMMASPAQRPPPTQETTKRPIKKSGPVWVKLHKDGDGWKIVSVSDKPQTL
jgi:hypothetical protein